MNASLAKAMHSISVGTACASDGSSGERRNGPKNNVRKKKALQSNRLQ
jgi:hypothetical protein